MQLAGKVIKVYETRKGTNDRGVWVRQGFVIETQEAYPKKVYFEISNPGLVDLLKEGDMVVVTFMLMSREYQDRWYTTVKAVGFGKFEQPVVNPIDNV